MRDFDAGGLSLNFFKSPRLESERMASPQEKERIIARNMLRFLMMKWEGSGYDIFSSRLLKAVLIGRDPGLLRGMRHAFQEGFQHIYEQLQDEEELSSRQNNQAHFFIRNCLSILPFADLSGQHSFRIPQRIHDQWQLVEYKVTPIELTPTRGVETLFMYDEDRVFAYGLEPVEHVDAESILIFMGTTYPAGQGFAAQLDTDLEGFETVGSSLYRTGHKEISTWLDKQTKKTQVCGTSLGGALALLLAIHQGEKLSRVDVLNPPGLYDSWTKRVFDRWDDIDEDDKPDVFIQKQGNDLVSSLGSWKKEWNIVRVMLAKAASTAILDHSLNYAGYADTSFELINTEQDNEARRVRNVLLYGLARGAIYYFGILPHHYLIRPVRRYAYDHLAQLACLGLVFACILPCVSLNFALLAVLVPVALHVVSKLVASADVWMGFADLPTAKLHEPVLEEIQLNFG